MSTYNILYVLLVFSFALSSIAMWINWRLNPQELAVRDWAISLSLVLVGCAFSVAARLNILDEQSMAEVNFYTLLRDIGIIINGLAWLIIWAAMRRFMGRPLIKLQHILGYTVLFSLFVFAAHPLQFGGAWGVACISIMVSLCSSFILYELLKPGRGGAAIWISGVGFSIAIISWTVRALLSLMNLDRPIDEGFDTVVMFTAVISAYSCMFGLVLLTNQRLIDQLAPGLSRDEQTGMLSKDSFEELTQALLDDAKTVGHPCCMVRLSVDNAAEIAYEHDSIALATALRQISNSSIQVLGRNDLFCRYGQKEFLFFLYGKSETLAFSSMFRLKTFLEQYVIETKTGAFRVRLSMKVVQWNAYEALSVLIQKTAIDTAEDHQEDGHILLKSVREDTAIRFG